MMLLWEFVLLVVIEMDEMGLGSIGKVRGCSSSRSSSRSDQLLWSSGQASVRVTRGHGFNSGSGHILVQSHKFQLPSLEALANT